MINEIWLPIKGYEGMYEVSNLGNVKSLLTFKLIGGRSPSKKGYLRVNLNNRIWFVHRVVAETFLPRIEGKDQVNHKDGNKLNNSVDNLEWVSNQENRDHAVKHDLIVHGERVGTSKLKKEEIIEIRNLCSQGISQKIIALQFGVAKQTVSNINTLKTWKRIKDRKSGDR